MLRQNTVLVVIPAYNRPDQLKRAVTSVLQQRYRDFSLVVVDDASTEDIGECEALVRENGHDWLRLSANVGPALARNKGAEGRVFQWVAFLDSDDIWLPDKLESQIAWCADNPAFRISQVRESWFRNGESFAKPPHLEQTGGDIFRDCVERCAIGPSCVMIRHDLWQESGGFDARFRVCEDYELWLRVASRDAVGLVEGPALVEKYGGHDDQLSVLVPALDRFRFAALALFLNRAQGLSPQNRDVVHSGLTKRAKILAKGAARRGRQEWLDFFLSVEPPLSPEEIEKAFEYCSISEHGA
ncbi:MAG: glycosyltransferase family A protein [Verrucomicrobiales bacterium]|nr:glycosyltransferase family A protein [Verrucomicrobiales bacterium]